MTLAKTASHRRVVRPGVSAEGEMPVEIWTPGRAPRGVALIAHGRNGAPGQVQMVPLIEAALARGFGVVAPHLCHSAGNESAGAPEGFTMAGHLADLASVRDWARAAIGWERGGLLLIGHSMGAYAVCRLAAEAAPGEVAGLLCVSPVISGRALIAARRRMGPEALALLAEEVPGAAAEWPEHDLAPVLARLVMPAAVLVGADDTVTPPADAEWLARGMPGCRRFEVLEGEHHCPVGAGYVRAVAAALDAILPGAERAAG